MTVSNISTILQSEYNSITSELNNVEQQTIKKFEENLDVNTITSSINNVATIEKNQLDLQNNNVTSNTDDTNTNSTSNINSTSNTNNLGTSKTSDTNTAVKEKTVANNISSVNAKLISNIPESAENKYSGIVQKMSEKYDVPENIIMKVIETESNFNQNAKSSAGAMGLMQLMPKTADYLGVENPYDPAQNIEGGVKYLKQMIDQFDNWKLALAAYNAGPGNVRKYDGIPPFTETQNYVKKILGN